MRSDDSPTIHYVQMDGVAVMKLAKHCSEEAAGNLDMAQGALLGLVVDNRLEVTNCFPFPKAYDEYFDEEEYQLDMMRKLRRVNVDHYHAGWYQCSEVGSFLTVPLLDSQFHYQISIEEAVVVNYDTSKTDRGFLTMKAYRLTPQAINMYREGEFTTDVIRNLKLSYKNIFEEVPVVIRNSSLTNILMTELGELIPPQLGSNFLDLSTSSVLEQNLRNLMTRVDELNQEAIKFNRYQQAVVRQSQEKARLIQKRNLENSARASRDEPPLPEEDLNKLFRPITMPPRLVPMMMAGQIDAYSQNISEFCSQSLAKLFIMQSLEEKN
jgi:translation initiation factor 3 subunit H